MPDLLIGVVTHPRTRFPSSAGDDGLAQRLRRALCARGMEADVVVHGDDLHDEAVLLIDRAEVERSIDAELDTERRWRRYLKPRRSALLLDAIMRARRARRRRRYLPRGGRGLRPDDAGYRMVRRLVNIELAHVALMREAVARGAEWALILEDDATALPDEAGAFAESLVDLVEAHRDSTQPQFINVSRSFDSGDLGVAHLLRDGGPWNAVHEPDVRIMVAERPVTNTVCAILYRASFLARLLREFEAIPLSPVLPIDWKLNAALMSMVERGALGDGDCWMLSPAPIVQGSMA